MKRVLIITSCPWRESIARHARPDQSVDTLAISSTFLGWDGGRLVARAGNGGDFREYDYVHMLDWGPYASTARLLAAYLKANGIPTMADQLLASWPASKLAEMYQITSAGLPYPKTFYTPRVAACGRLYEWARGHGLALPLVQKDIRSTLGQNNFRITEEQEIVTSGPRGLSYVLQEYIPNDHDYRVLVIGGRSRLVIKRQRKDDTTHLNNTAQGARPTVIEVADFPAEHIQLAEAAARATQRIDISGVDLMVSKDGRPYILEVNMCPSMTDRRSGEASIRRKMTALYEHIASVTDERPELVRP